MIINPANALKLTNDAGGVKDVINIFRENGLSINQEKTLADQIVYDTVRLAPLATGNFTFFSGAPDLVRTNLTNFNKPESEHSFIYGVRILVADSATIAGVTFFSPPGFLSESYLDDAKFTLNVNGVQVLKKIPTSDFNASDDSGQGFGVYPLLIPVVWGGQQEIQAFIESPNAVSSVNGLVIRLELIGVGLI